MAVSALSLVVAFFFARQVSAPSRRRGILKRQYKTVAALLGLLLLPAFAGAQEAAGGEASLKLPDLSVVNHFGLSGPALLMIGLLFCVRRPDLRPGDPCAVEEPAGS